MSAAPLADREAALVRATARAVRALLLDKMRPGITPPALQHDLAALEQAMQEADRHG